MAKKIDYASMFTLRSDGRYQGYWHDTSGKRHTICDRDAETLYHKIQLKEQPTSSLFSDIADEWYEDHCDRVGFKTAEAYKAPLRRIIDRFGNQSISDISAAPVNAFLLYLSNRGYAKRTVQMHRDIINMIMNHAIVAGIILSNPCAAVSMPRNLRVTPRALPDDDAIEAVKRRTDVPFSLFASVCLYSGLRRGEALALRYEDIDRQNKIIHVTKSVEFVGNNPHIKSTKTVSGNRDVILLDVLANLIPDEKIGYVFSRDDGGMLTKTQYRKRWQKYCEIIGHDITAHQLRHGYATILFEAGIPDKDAQELLGHSDITVTRNIYTHIRQSHRNETAAKLNAFVQSGSGK